MREVTFTLDVEDHGARADTPRAPMITRQVIEALAERRVRGTFFVVGELAHAHPDLVRDIATAGHELALHGWTHQPLTTVAPDGLLDDLRRGREQLEAIAQQPVVGFRAPTFSLVPESQWTLDVMVAAGFTYSSSVLPARSPLFGDASQPRVPFRWPNGLVELPCPVATFGRPAKPLVANPYLGGVYFRVLPWPLIRYGLAHAGDDEALWLYSHPYDFDPDEPFRARPELGRLGSRLMWFGRSRMARRVARVLDGTTATAGPPLGEIAAAFAAH